MTGISKPVQTLPRMKVLFLARWYPSHDHAYNGIFVREHAKAVRAAGDEVAVLHLVGVPGGGRGLWRMEEELDPTITEGIPAYRVYHRSVSIRHLARISYWLTYGLFVWSALGAARRLHGSGFRPDLIHAHVYSAGVPAVILGRLSGRPVVITEHLTDFTRHTLEPGPRKRARFAFQRAARVLPVCCALQKAISSYGIKALFQVVPNAVDTSMFFWAKRVATPGRPRRMIFVGNLEPTQHKGFPTLVEALKSLNERRGDWHLDVIGEGPSQADCERLVNDANLSEKVAFMGARPKDEIAEMMRSSDLFVLPSRFENLPCVLIEAMTSGLPVVATRVGGIPEMISERDGILVPPDDPAVLAEALDQVLANRISFDSDDIASRARARYSLDVVGAQLHAVYDVVISTAHGKASAPRSTPTEP